MFLGCLYKCILSTRTTSVDNSIALASLSKASIYLDFLYYITVLHSCSCIRQHDHWPHITLHFKKSLHSLVYFCNFPLSRHLTYLRVPHLYMSTSHLRKVFFSIRIRITWLFFICIKKMSQKKNENSKLQTMGRLLLVVNFLYTVVVRDM